MQEINEIIKKYELKPRKYTKKNKTTIIETDQEKYIIKQKPQNIQNIYDYLKTRNFNYIPKIINDIEDKYQITNYIEQFEIPPEQKIIDLIELVGLLHNKTTHYKEVTEDNHKEMYEDIKNNIQYLYSYYNDLMTIIESKIYMSPCEYLIARNITRIYESLEFAQKELETWYSLIKNKTKQRYVILHNNLELSHFIENEKKYLISWDKSKIGIPIFDIYKLYLNHGLEFNFEELLKIYEKSYPLYEEERKLLFILISLPQKITLEKSEYENTKEAGKKIDLICKTKMLLSPYYSDKTPKNDSHK